VGIWGNTQLLFGHRRELKRSESFIANGTPTIGLSLMLVAFFCFAVMDTSAKWLVVAAIPSLQVAFVRYFVHFLWVILIYFPRDGFSITRSKVPHLQVLRAILLFTSTALNFTALKYLPLTTTIAFFFAAPMVVCLLSIPILKEKVGLKRFAAIAVGFIGVLIIVAPWGEQFDHHIFLAVGATLGASGYFVMTRIVAGKDSNSTAQFYTAGVATVFLAPVAWIVWEAPATPLNWGLLIILGSFGMLGHSVLTLAHRFAEASVLAPTVYSQIIYVTLFSWLFFDSVPTLSTAIGVSIIVASGIYIWRRERALEWELRQT